MKHVIDATNQSVGRLATQVATILRGKTQPTYKPYEMPTDTVVVEHATKMKFTGDKLNQKMFFHYSGYHGGLKEKPLKEVFAKNPAEVLRKAVYGMLASNKLRSKIIKNLTIND